MAIQGVMNGSCMHTALITATFDYEDRTTSGTSGTSYTLTQLTT
jgi:hypothetical protein